MPGPVVLLLAAISIVLLIVKIGALIDCIARPAQQFEAAQTLDKKAWLLILALTVLVQLVWNPLMPIGILNLVGTVAALVYLAQLRGQQR